MVRWNESQYGHLYSVDSLRLNFCLPSLIAAVASLLVLKLLFEHDIIQILAPVGAVNLCVNLRQWLSILPIL